MRWFWGLESFGDHCMLQRCQARSGMCHSSALLQAEQACYAMLVTMLLATFLTVPRLLCFC